MRRWTVGTMVVAAAMSVTGPAFALGQLGVRLGMGAESGAGPGAEAGVPTAAGAAWKADLTLVGLEVDALYRRTTYETDPGATEAHLGLPVTARVDVPLVPALLGLEFGAGVEPRFRLSGRNPEQGDAEDVVWYVPFVFGATLDLQVISANTEVRYERQVTDAISGDDARNHQLMFFVGAFF